MTRAVLGAVYSQLQEMVGVLGWVSGGLGGLRGAGAVGCCMSPGAVNTNPLLTALLLTDPPTDHMQDGFLAVRSSVFVMHETARSPSSSTAAHAATQEPRSQQQSGAGAGEPAAAGAAAPRQGHQQQQQQQPAPSPDGASAPANDVRRGSTSGGKSESADPAAFYASRLQAALGGGTPSGAASGQQVAGGGAQQPAGSAGGVFEPMAGRVLLLGRSSRRLSSVQDAQRIKEEWRRSSSSGGGSQRTTSLAGRAGVENLSRLGGASVVAPLPNQQPAAQQQLEQQQLEQQPAVAPQQHKPAVQQQQQSQPTTPLRPQGSSPSLWQMVFGGGVTQHGQEGQQAAKDLVAAPDGLPRIRTRPLGEGREEAAQADSPARPLAEGSEEAATGGSGGQQSHPPQQPASAQHQQGLLHAGSLLLRGRPGGETPLSSRARQQGALHSLGSGPLSPSILSRIGSASGAPQLRSLEADREAVAAGRQLVRPEGGVPPSSGGSQQPGSQLLRWDSSSAAEPGVRLCVRWLDELVVALWVSLLWWGQGWNAPWIICMVVSSSQCA